MRRSGLGPRCAAILAAWASAAAAQGTPTAAIEARCDALAERQEWLAARDCFQALLDRLPPGHPDRSPALYNRAYSVARTGDDCAATRAWSAYLEEAPREAEADRRLKAAEARDRSRLSCERALDPDFEPAPPPPPPPSAPAAGRLLASVGLGYGADAAGDGRTPARLEVGYGHFFGPLGLTLVAAVPVEPPSGFALRPGVRLELDERDGRPFLHAGLLIALAPDANGAGLGGIGYTYRVAPSLGLLAQLDAGWRPATDGFFVEGRGGVEWRF